MSLEELGPIDHGVVLVLREVIDPDEPDENRMERHAETVAEIVRVCGHTDFTLLIVDPTTSIEMLDVDMMREAGWERIPAGSPGNPITVAPGGPQLRPSLESDSDADT